MLPVMVPDATTGLRRGELFALKWAMMKARWAARRKAAAKPAPKATSVHRTMSPAARKKIAAAQRKRLAAVKKAKSRSNSSSGDTGAAAAALVYYCAPHMHCHTIHHAADQPGFIDRYTARTHVWREYSLGRATEYECLVPGNCGSVSVTLRWELQHSIYLCR
jgi:integrase